MKNVYKNTEEYNLGNKHKVLIVFGDMIADMISKKKLIQYQLSYLLVAENKKLHLLLSRNHFLKWQKTLE